MLFIAPNDLDLKTGVTFRNSPKRALTPESDQKLKYEVAEKEMKGQRSAQIIRFKRRTEPCWWRFTLS